MAFTTQDVKNLRETTGCGMMDCKKALTETDGDMQKAIDLLAEWGGEVVEPEYTQGVSSSQFKEKVKEAK